MKRYLSFYKIMLLLSVVLYTLSGYWGVRAITRNSRHYCLGFEFEENIPLVPWMIYIYLGSYLFWAVNYILAVQGSRKEAYRFILSDIIAKTICFELYVLLPTTLSRPEIAGNSLVDFWLRNLYRWDMADNLFPSIHCLMSVLSYMGVRRSPGIPAWYRVFSLFFAMAVCVSTLTVKQHVLVDVPAGILLAVFGYWLAGKCVYGIQSGEENTNKKETSYFKYTS